VWRKRRLRLAELAAHRRGLGDALSGKTAAAALVLVDVEGQSGWVVNAIRATAADTEKAIREMQEQKAMTRRAIKLLGSESGDAYQAASTPWRSALKRVTSVPADSADMEGLVSLIARISSCGCGCRSAPSRVRSSS
jgi:hypothetical protein